MPLPPPIDPQIIGIHEAPPILAKFTYTLSRVSDFLTFRDLPAMFNPEPRYQGAFLFTGLPNSSKLSSSFPFENQGEKKQRHKEGALLLDKTLYKSLTPGKIKSWPKCRKDWMI
ncbi:conserved hypothetical protein [Ricinus communis]|uniref:Uncharacterized protein n=1 Tax=Ricinus communis TaxID=3988 RepID=B9SXU0_RICCO|nr:conserved hypothetical protein [Ricinus communis]